MGMAKLAHSADKSKVRRGRVARKRRFSLEERAAIRKKKAEIAAAKAGPSITIQVVDARNGEVKVVRFGAVTVSNPIPDAETLAHNIKAGRDALLRAKGALVQRGVKLHHRAEVPKFRVDANNPRLLIRELNGRVDRGHFVNGTFVTAE